MIPVINTHSNLLISQPHFSEQSMLGGASVSRSNAIPQTFKNSKVLKDETNNKLTLLVHQGKLVLTFAKAASSLAMTVEERNQIVLPEVKSNEFLDLSTAAKWIKRAREKYQPDKVLKKRLPLTGRNLLYAKYIDKIIAKLMVQGFSVDTILALVEKKRFSIEHVFNNVLNTAAQQWSDLAQAYWSEIEQPTAEEIKNHQMLLAKITTAKLFPFNFFRMKTILFFIHHFDRTNNIETQKEVLINLICFKMRINYKELMLLLKEIKSNKINAILTQEEKKNLRHIASLYDLAEHKRFDKLPLSLDCDSEQETFIASKRARLEEDEEEVSQANANYFTLEELTYITMDTACGLISQAVCELPTTIKNDFFVQLTTKLIKQGIKAEEVRKRLASYGRTIYRAIEDVTKGELNQIAIRLNLNVKDLAYFDVLAYYRVTTMLNLLLAGESAQHICKLMELSASDYEDYLIKGSSACMPLLNQSQKTRLKQAMIEFEGTCTVSSELQCDAHFSEQALTPFAVSTQQCTQQDIRLPDFGTQLEPFNGTVADTSLPNLTECDTQQPAFEQPNIEQLDFFALEQPFNQALIASPVQDMVNFDLATSPQYHSASFSHFLDFLESDSNISLDQLNDLLNESA